MYYAIIGMYNIYTDIQTEAAQNKTVYLKTIHHASCSL